MAKLVPNTQTGSLTDHEHGTDDTLIGVNAGLNTLYGDAFDMFDHSRGGDDTLIGGDHATNLLYGDAHDMHDHSRGGDDAVGIAHR